MSPLLYLVFDHCLIHYIQLYSVVHCDTVLMSMLTHCILDVVNCCVDITVLLVLLIFSVDIIVIIITRMRYICWPYSCWSQTDDWADDPLLLLMVMLVEGPTFPRLLFHLVCDLFVRCSFWFDWCCIWFSLIVCRLRCWLYWKGKLKAEELWWYWRKYC